MWEAVAVGEGVRRTEERGEETDYIKTFASGCANGS